MITNSNSDHVQCVKKIIKIYEELLNQYYLGMTPRIKLDISRDDFKFSVENYFSLPLKNFATAIKIYTQKNKLRNYLIPEEKKFQHIEYLKTNVEKISRAIISSILSKSVILRPLSIECSSLPDLLSETKKDDINLIEAQKNYSVTIETQNPSELLSLPKLRKTQNGLKLSQKESKVKEEKKTVKEIKKSKSFNVSSLKHSRENKVIPRLSSIKPKQTDFDKKSINIVGEYNSSGVQSKQIEKISNKQEDIKKGTSN